MESTDPTSLQNAIREGYLRYYDTAFHLRDPALMAERHGLLEASGAILGEPLIEPVIPYEGTEALRDVCAGAGLTQQLADDLGRMVFNSDGSFLLRQHQANSLRASLAADEERNVVVTSGTGSGKTECFLLPILARLLAQLEATKPEAELNRWWERGERGRWEPARRDGIRGAALRAVVLYPTNALVEDQVGRLRRAVARAPRRGGGPPLFFGRYTGATEGRGPIPGRLSGDRVRETAEMIREAQRERLELEGRGEELLSQFAAPADGELISRWDMIATPPDVLVTNYSMLNVMLMRDREQRIFDLTREWLEQDDGAVLTLVVDELHTYRGTQGAEVALVVRNLLRRLGLPSDSPKLRCIGTSASLAGDHAGDFLEQFFGVPASTFRIVAGTARRIRELRPIPADRLLGENGSTTELELDEAIAGACASDHGYRATRHSVIADRLFVADDAETRRRALDAALGRIADHPDERGGVPLRSHHFARLVRGMWACADPGCSKVPADLPPSGERAIGRLFDRPVARCGCGARVLELLYCFQCGEVSLGGFIVEGDADEQYLSALSLSAVAAQRPAFCRSTSEYVWYSPYRRSTDATWAHSLRGDSYQFQFTPVELQPLSGLLFRETPSPTGVAMRVEGPAEPDASIEIPAIPERCPRCDARGHNRNPAIFSRATVRSPIRAHTTGTARTTQVVMDRVLQEIGGSPEERRSIVFTDSRDDAARTAAGMEANHFLDLVRALTERELESPDTTLGLLRSLARGEDLAPIVQQAA